MDKEKIEKYAMWYDTFNCWGWPEDYPYAVKPENWDELPSWSRYDEIETKNNHIKPQMNLIKCLIGDKECMRWHHINNIGVKNYQFEIWWFTQEIIGFIKRNISRDFYLNIYDIMKLY